MSEAKKEITDRFLKVLAGSEWAPRDELMRYQQGLIEGLVRHAHEHVPFYRDRLSCLFGRQGEIDLARWHEVPIVTRSEAAAHAAEMRAPELSAKYGAVGEFRTSGSTNVPMTVAINSLVQIASNAALTRMARWWGVETSQALARIRLFPHAPPPKYPEGRSAKGWSRSNPTADVYELDLMTPAEQQLEWLSRRKAPYLMTSASNATALAYAATPQIKRDLAIKLIFAIAETVLPRAREIVAERLGAEMAAIYSCEEIGFIATQCPAAPCYHVVAENALVEILDEDGAPTAPGDIGMVVVTGLYNYAMPFIRYAVGDVATAGPDFCTCGRSLPVITQVEGRTRHAFRFRDGTRVWPRPAVMVELGTFVAYREFQIVQVDYEHIEFRYVPDNVDRLPDPAGLSAYLRKWLHPSVNVVLVPMQAIPRGPAGKFDPVMSMILD